GFADFGEVRVLTQQAVARMYGVDISDLCGADNGRGVQVALGGTRRAHADGFIGKTDVQRGASPLAGEGNRPNAELFAGADNAQSDLATVGDEDLLEH